ncbi:uncharacterized protein K452DRAFT_67618 [Aplosporella prunicola CBS 121167]|uniref:Uncharacterized protein n=1 Tax=Aplosporella prunicola CBS 121167 TaxID=1176127 RepID=A0A6A6BTH9_9PEZI|nr:uncharacterized protein K452DRAFT_67618 [Aplosporella prunicola CBS 121167]KAF2146575.1 hypothetical protein K452DRAFT_67618 [Aplosporella prunicola CBS 121167]
MQLARAQEMDEAQAAKQGSVCCSERMDGCSEGWPKDGRDYAQRESDVDSRVSREEQATSKSQRPWGHLCTSRAIISQSNEMIARRDDRAATAASPGGRRSIAGRGRGSIERSVKEDACPALSRCCVSRHPAHRHKHTPTHPQSHSIAQIKGRHEHFFFFTFNFSSPCVVDATQKRTRQPWPPPFLCTTHRGAAAPPSTTPPPPPPCSTLDGNNNPPVPTAMCGLLQTSLMQGRAPSAQSSPRCWSPLPCRRGPSAARRGSILPRQLRSRARLGPRHRSPRSSRFPGRLVY